MEQTLVQLTLAVCFAFGVWSFLRLRHRIADIEARLARYQQELREEKGVQRIEILGEEPKVASKEPGIKEELLSARAFSIPSTLSEREVVEVKGTDFVDAYAEAAKALNSGEKLEEVAKSTGISLSELRLLQRITGSSSEISAT